MLTTGQSNALTIILEIYETNGASMVDLGQISPNLRIWSFQLHYLVELFGCKIGISRQQSLRHQPIDMSDRIDQEHNDHEHHEDKISDQGDSNDIFTDRIVFHMSGGRVVRFEQRAYHIDRKQQQTYLVLIGLLASQPSKRYDYVLQTNGPDTHRFKIYYVLPQVIQLPVHHRQNQKHQCHHRLDYTTHCVLQHLFRFIYYARIIIY
jgi:hypothetical protein